MKTTSIKTMSTKTVAVPNISCGHCVKTIEHDIGEVAGVATVHANLESKNVTVEWSEPANWDRIRSEMDEIGFPVKE